MKTKALAVSAIAITEVVALDSIHAYWCDAAEGAGYVTINCYGCAWTAYFGAMGDRTIRQFFSEVDTPYLITKLGITPTLKQSKRADAYLGRIIDAVKAALAQ